MDHRPWTMDLGGEFMMASIGILGAEVRDEVLARLLALNQERHEDEVHGLRE